jgi:hypothetical protein
VHVPLQRLGYYGPGPIAGQWDPKLFAGSCEIVPTAGVYVVVYMYVTFV